MKHGEVFIHDDEEDGVYKYLLFGIHVFRFKGRDNSATYLPENASASPMLWKQVRRNWQFVDFPVNIGQAAEYIQKNYTSGVTTYPAEDRRNS